jgi:hypothetical protein
MISFYEYVAGQLGTRLPDTHTMLSMAGVSLESPDEEDTERLLNRARKRPVPQRPGGNAYPATKAPGNPARPNGNPGLPHLGGRPSPGV